MNRMGIEGSHDLKISHDLIEWRSRLEGPDGLLLLLVLMFLYGPRMGRGF